jgi:hypothetical protein
MDEYLFISMAKLGADRVKAERLHRAAGEPPARPAIVMPERRVDASKAIEPTEFASRLAIFALLFAGALAAIGVGGGLAAALEKVPAGEVTVTELGASSGEVKVAQAE